MRQLSRWSPNLHNHGLACRRRRGIPVLPEYNLSGRVALLHTAGGGEAPLLAQALAEAGATVFTVARSQQLLDPIMAVLDRLPGGHDGVAAEVGRGESDLARAIAAFDGVHDRLDILVNDGRSMFARPFDEVSREEWDEVQSRNARATALLCQEAGRRMRERRYGRIVNIVSVLAERGMANAAAFAASQASVLSLTRSLALEWGRHNIRVNAIGCGWFTSEDVPLEEQQKELLVRYTPLRRKGHPRDIASLLVYLCSEACDYLTGQPVYVDGGLNAHP